jgi:hypothetical protein
MDDRRSHKKSNCSKPSGLVGLGKMDRLERHDVYVRAHTPVRPKKEWDRKWSEKWPRYCLIWDTETRVDAKQKLTFGCYRRCVLNGYGYRCIEEGVFYADDLPQNDVAILGKYRDDKRNIASIESFPAKTSIGLMTRSSFVNRIFWRAIQRRELIVGFNLPFDLSRLAVRFGNGRKNSWSLAFSKREGRKSGKSELNPERPRIVITSQNSKMAFIKLGSVLHPEEWPKEGRFLDLRTLGWALRNEAYSLKRACKAFGVEGKIKHKPSGRVTAKEITYCRGDVGATARVLNAMRIEFDRNPIKAHPDKVYSPASIAKAYLDAMNIKLPKAHFRVPHKTVGIAMQTYYGGRAECRIRRTKVPVIHTDFTSQYPTVNALLGNWDVLKASSIHFEDCARAARQLLSGVRLNDAFDQELWKRLSFFALVKPGNDILPVRTVYGGKTQNIGLNFIRSEKPIWYAGPDIVASKLLTGKSPRILKAIRMVANGCQSVLRTTNLGGMVEISPTKGDFYRTVIEQRFAHKAKSKPVADFLKVLANSGSYGLFVEVNAETNIKEKNVSYFSGEKSGKKLTNYVEKPGAWYFPPLASLITSGGRLLLAMLEKSVKNLSGSYLFCDTDSLCIVGSERQQLVPCIGGQFKLNGKDAVRTLSLKQVEGIATKFNRLNPYNPNLVRDILKIEEINHIDSDPSKPYRQLFGYAVSAKRYALFTESEKDIVIEKASGHGLGYLFAPKERNSDEDDAGDELQETPEWILEAWEYLLRKEFQIQQKKPAWLKLPAMMRMVMSSPNVLRNRRPDWLAPYNFFLFPILSGIEGYPFGYDKSTFQFITRSEIDRKRWNKLKGINLRDGRTFQISMSPDPKQETVFPDSLQVILNQYLGKAEVKSLAPDGAPCDARTEGLLRRAKIVARNLIPVGKETDRHWEQGEDPSMLDPKIQTYGPSGKLAVADSSERSEWVKIGVRQLMRATRLTQRTVYSILSGKGVRHQTMAMFRVGIDFFTPKYQLIRRAGPLPTSARGHQDRGRL